MEPIPPPPLNPVTLAEADFESQSLSPFSTDHSPGLDPSPASGHYEIGDDPASYPQLGIIFDTPIGSWGVMLRDRATRG